MNTMLVMRGYGLEQACRICAGRGWREAETAGPDDEVYIHDGKTLVIGEKPREDHAITGSDPDVLCPACEEGHDD